MRKNDAFVAKIVNTRLTKIFMAIFAPDKRLPSSATLLCWATKLMTQRNKPTPPFGQDGLMLWPIFCQNWQHIAWPASLVNRSLKSPFCGNFDNFR